MKTIADPDRLLAEGLARLRERFSIPADFPSEVVAAAEVAARRPARKGADWTDRPFVTLDPASSTDLDQAFWIEPAGGDLLLHYAMADVASFVDEGGAIEAEAWRRGVTIYLPDQRARLYPAELSERAASLLPDGPRPAVIATVRCDAGGEVRLDGMVSGVIRSRAKFAYETAALDDIPGLAEFAARMSRAEASRGAARVDPPEQEISRDAQGRYRLTLRQRTAAEEANAALSLAANIAIANALHAAGTGLFREMPEPGAEAIRHLRQTSRGLGLVWPAARTLAQFEATVDPGTVAGASFQLAVRRMTGGADYVPFSAGHRPWHAALGATYCHATAPMRRLADRYVLDAALAITAGTARRPDEAELFARLATTMNTADQREAAIERAVLDLAEAALLADREGDVFRAIVTGRDEKGARLQLIEDPVITRVDTHSVASGDEIHVRLVSADPVRGELRFERVR